MNKTESRLDLWQILAPILDESIAQSLRDMDDNEAVLDSYDSERLQEVYMVFRDLADWFAPEKLPWGDSAIDLKRLYYVEIRDKIIKEADSIKRIVRSGNSTLVPIPLTERSPTAQDFDPSNTYSQCWWFRSVGTWKGWVLDRQEIFDTHWLPYDTFPIPSK
jgi:hypothetical protein